MGSQEKTCERSTLAHTTTYRMNTSVREAALATNSNYASMTSRRWLKIAGVFYRDYYCVRAQHMTRATWTATVLLLFSEIKDLRIRVDCSNKGHAIAMIEACRILLQRRQDKRRLIQATEQW